MASTGNQQCANGIGALSFAIKLLYLISRHFSQKVNKQTADVNCAWWIALVISPPQYRHKMLIAVYEKKFTVSYIIIFHTLSFPTTSQCCSSYIGDTVQNITSLSHRTTHRLLAHLNPDLFYLSGTEKKINHSNKRHRVYTNACTGRAKKLHRFFNTSLYSRDCSRLFLLLRFSSYVSSTLHSTQLVQSEQAGR